VAGVLPVVMVSFVAICGIGVPWSLRARAKISMSSSMTLGRPPWLPWPRRPAGLPGSSRGCSLAVAVPSSCRVVGWQPT